MESCFGLLCVWTNGKNCRKSFRRFRRGIMGRKLHFQQMMVDEISHQKFKISSKFTIFLQLIWLLFTKVLRLHIAIDISTIINCATNFNNSPKNVSECMTRNIHLLLKTKICWLLSAHKEQEKSIISKSKSNPNLRFMVLKIF